MATNETSFGGHPDIVKDLMARPWGDGVRKNGIYEMPGEYLHDGVRCPASFKPDQLDYIKNKMEFNEKDVLSVAFGKTGSTWVNNLIFLVCNNADVELGKNVSPVEILPFLECNIPGLPPVIDVLEAMTTPRLVKSHLPLRYFQRNLDKMACGPKVIVATRNPKDTLVSFYHFYKINPLLGCFDGDWNEFFELFRQKHLLYEDMFDHTATWWNMREHPNVHYIKYEDLKSNISGEIRKLACFLDKPLTDTQVEIIEKATTFDKLKSSKFIFPAFVNPDDADKNFFRRGQVGGWREYFTEEQSAYIDELCEKRYAPIGLHYQY